MIVPSSVPFTLVVLSMPAPLLFEPRKNMPSPTVFRLIGWLYCEFTASTPEPVFSAVTRLLLKAPKACGTRTL